MTDSTHTPQPARLLDCGLCFEEQGEEVHPHPECPIGTVARYHRRADEVQAVQWTGSNVDELRAFAGPHFDTIDPEDRIEDGDQDAQVLIEASYWTGISPGYWVLKFEDHLDVERDENFRAGWAPAVVPVVSAAVPPTTQTADRDLIAAAIWERQNPGRRWADCEYRWRADAEADADAVLVVLRGLTLRELEQLHRPNTPPSRPEPRLPDHAVNEEEAPAPVKQRADCTELEWAEQERARFERLYTRESVRADQAEELLRIAHETSNRSEAERASAVKRAEAMERAMESTAADALAHRGCHRDLMAQCLRAKRAEAEAEQLRAGRAAALLEAAQHLYTALFPAVYDDMGQKAAEGVNRAVSELRRLAAEAQPDTPTVGDVKQMLTRMRANASTHDLDYLPRLFARWVASSEGRDALVDELVAGGYRLPHACGNCEGIDPDTCLTNPDRPDASAAVQTDEEASNPRTVCVCGHTKGEHLRVSGRLLCDACDPDSTENLTCTGFDAL